MKKSEKQEKLEENLRENLKNMKVDGLPNIFRTNLLPFQIMWIVILLFSFSFCVYLLTISFLDYFKFQVTTNFRLLSELKSTFPTVTICNMNPLNSDYAVSLMVEANLSASYDADEPHNTMLALEEWHKRTTGEYFSAAERKRMSSFTIVSCTYADKACDSDSFTYLFHPYFLACYQFNSGFDANGTSTELKQSNVDGTSNALVLELYAGLPDTLAAQTYQRGFYIFINNNTAYPLTKTQSLLNLTPGFGMMSNVVRGFYTQFNQWPYQYSDCTVNEESEPIKPLEDMELFEAVKKTGFDYSRDTCFLFCYQELSAKRCNCTNYWIDHKVEGGDHEYEYCLSEEEKACAKTFYEDVFNVGTYIDEHCIAKCPLECHKQTFDNFLSYYSYPEATYVSQELQTSALLLALYSNQSDFTTSLASNVVEFSVFYDTLSYTKVEEEPKITWDALMGTLGGHLHIFLGMSLLSFIEIFEFVSELILLAFYIRKNKVAMHTGHLQTVQTIAQETFAAPTAPTPDTNTVPSASSKVSVHSHTSREIRHAMTQLNI